MLTNRDLNEIAKIVSDKLTSNPTTVKKPPKKKKDKNNDDKNIRNRLFVR